MHPFANLSHRPSPTSLPPTRSRLWLSLGALALSALSQAQWRRYSMVRFDNSRPYSLTDRGDLLTSGGAFRADGSQIQLPGGFTPFRQNNQGEFVGYTDSGNGVRVATWREGESLRDRGGYGDGRFWGIDINDQGTIHAYRNVRDSLAGDSGLLKPDGTYQVLSDAPQSILAGVVAGFRSLNSSGQAISTIANEFFNGVGNSRRAFWDGQGLTPFNGFFDTVTATEPRYLNDSGMAVGRLIETKVGPFGDSIARYGAWYWPTPTTGFEVAPPSGYASSVFETLDPSGTAFGTASTDRFVYRFSANTRAVAFRPDMGQVFFDGLVANLPVGDRVVELTQTNGLGDVAGVVMRPDGGTYTARFTASPVPEPASFAALGLGALALLRRRQSLKD